MAAYYNEIDPFAAQWLRNLIESGHIAPGYVDERSIEDVYPSDLRGFTQCHFFAGIGVWSHALRAAGWRDDRPVWTGSCPCQPFSAAGAGAGFADERHLWPAFHHLVKECSPAVVFGEQVASKAAEPWIDALQIDMEALGYGVAAIAFPASSVGAPHIRDRLYWVADTTDQRLDGRRTSEAGDGRGQARVEPERFCDAGGLEHPRQYDDASQGQAADCGQSQTERPANIAGGSGVSLCGLDDTKGQRPGFLNPKNVWAPDAQIDVSTDASDREFNEPCGERPASMFSRPTNGLWRDADWLLCRDGKWRPVEPGTFPLVDGAASRVGRLRAYGNSINAKAGEVFIRAVMESIDAY
jgi:DNA (cytosine-5)-methyltransferase 1